MRLCRRHKVIFIIENPKASKLFDWPPLSRAVERAGGFISHFPQCAYGAPYQKWTSIATNGDGFKAMERGCGCPGHSERLQGRVQLADGTWHWHTSLASAYPPWLCRAYAACASAKARWRSEQVRLHCADVGARAGWQPRSAKRSRDGLSLAAPSGTSCLGAATSRSGAARRPPSTSGSARAAEKSRRARAVRRTNSVEETDRPSYLQRRSVRSETRARYLAASSEVEVFAREQGLACGTAEEADKAIAPFLDCMFFEGDTVPAGRLALYGFAWSHALPTRGAAFPKAKQALKGWRMICLLQSREPIPWAAVLIVSGYFVNRGDKLCTLTAALYLLCFDGYFRPSEALELRREAPCTPRGQWGVVVRPRALGTTPSKNGVFDDTVIVAEGRVERQWLCKVTAALHKLCRAGNPIFHEPTLPQIEKFVHEARQATGLALSRVVPWPAAWWAEP